MVAAHLAVIPACRACGNRRRTLDQDGLCRPCLREKLIAIPRPELIALRPDVHRPRRRWTEEEEGILRREYDGRWQTVERLANLFTRTASGVKGKAALLGLRRGMKSPDWTARELAVLEAWAEKQSPQWIHAHKLPKRSLFAITVKQKRLHLERRLHDGWYTADDACRLLGVDHRWLDRRIASGELRATGHTGSELPGATVHIAAADLRRFVLDHCGELTGRNVDLAALVALVAQRVAAGAIAPRERGHHEH